MEPALTIYNVNDEKSLSSQSSLRKPQLDPLCHILTPIGMLGYGFDEALTHQALQDLKNSNVPTALIIDSGSTDSGPAKLALGIMTSPRGSYERDFTKLLRLANTFHVPLLISSAGGDGSDAHVDEFLDIVREICEKGNNSYKFKTLAIYSNVSKAKVFHGLHAGEVKGCGASVPELTASDIEGAATIVAQMGPEPFVQAMEAEPDFDIIIGGRAYDPSPYVAFCIFQAEKVLAASGKTLTAEQLGGFTHMGKIMECGAICATPKSASAMATVYRDGTFNIKPLNADARCTPSSVAAHTLYEKSRPDILSGPGGNLNLTRSIYTQLPDQRTVRVHGATFQFSRDVDLPYTIKLEAAKMVGHRTIFMGGVRDPILISQMSSFQSRIQEYVITQNTPSSPSSGEFWKLGFHTYGANGIMGALEPGDSTFQPREIFIVGEVLASSQKLATSIAATARVAAAHGAYPGQRGTGGNFAMGVGGKLEVEMGPCAEFCIYHLMPLRVGEEGAKRIGDNRVMSKSDSSTLPLFSWKMSIIGKGDLTVAPEPPVRSSPATALDPPRQNPRPSQPSTLNLTSPLTLTDIAPVIRSKNSGPYEITLDVVFSSLPVYAIIKASSLLTPATLARMYHLHEADIVWCGFFDQAMAWKCTLPRRGDAGERRIAGGFMEADVHASQQYAGLLGLELGEEVRGRIRELGLGGGGE
ncbi:hypothetical protein LHYA1_G006398 [Lachnellula hyalina]|uniref:Caib baif family enzyme n=1 Tax=Lachnellula hyalina TaxID=1316788 RepID=A0A8H8QY50_9HELO|nr:uncharacterized protein LHYA1_G006398 [Lachnellula hyalina]TVY24646.1 hypothetical protein LHYA1_G006398 [Lachnellula hyalina]